MRHLIISVGGVIVLGGLLFLVKADIIKHTQITQKLKEELAVRNQAAESLIGLKTDSEKASEYLRILKNRLPLKDELINFPKEIINLANRNNVDLGFTFGSESSPEENPGNLSFSMTLSGNYDNTIKFLEATEKSRYFVEFETINLVRNDSVKDTLTGNLSGRVFIRNEAEKNSAKE